MIEGVPLTARHCTAASRARYCQHSYTEIPLDHAKGAPSPYGKLYVERNHETKRGQY